MKRLIPDPVVGALAGFALGFLASVNFVYLGMDISGWPVIGFGILGAVGGYVVGAFLQSPSSRKRTVARWCVTMAAVFGGVTFLIGFVGPIIFRPDLPQGPMLGIFCTGPLGTLAGAILGLLISC